MGVFPPGAAAYMLSETLAEPLFMTSWRGLRFPDSSTMCSQDAEISKVEACNVNYGDASTSTSSGGTGSTPATTFDALTYPSDLTNRGGDALGGHMGLESGGITYAMFLFGNKADGTGRIELVKYSEEFNSDREVREGSWTVVDTPFEHVRLNLPDGLYFQAYLDTLGGEGYAFLHEHKGFLRSGRAVPAGVEVPVMYGRNPDTLLLNAEARQTVLNQLGQKGKLAEHPGWTQED